VTVPGNSYPVELLGAASQPVLPQAVTLQFTDNTDEPGSGGGAGGTWPTYSGNGSPQNVVAAAAPGDTYADTTNGAIFLAYEANNSHWVCIGGNLQVVEAGVSSTITVCAINDAAGGNVSVANGSVAANPGASGDTVSLMSSKGAGVVVTDSGAVTELGFYGQAPAVQPILTALATAADIVAALQALGLSG
jgi:hypothetical protein